VTVDGKRPNLNVAFISRWSPARATVFGMAVYAVLILIAPLEYNTSVITADGLFYALAALTAFFVGCLVGRTYNSLSIPAEPEPLTPGYDRMIDVTAMLGAIGVMARIYDRFILRGFTVAQTYAESRESLAAGVSVFGYVGGLLFTFGFVALALIWLSGSQRRRPLMYALVVVLSAYPVAESLAQGSRLTLLNTSAFVFLLASSTDSLRWLLRSRIALLMTGVALIVLAQVIYEIRQLEGAAQSDLSDVFVTTAISVYARPKDWIIEFLISTNGEGVLGVAAKVAVHITQYLTHSWLVYFVNYEQFDGVAGWGNIHLNLPLRGVGALVGYELYDGSLHGAEEGIFATALSTLCYEFAGFGPLAAGVFGFAVTWVQGKAIHRPERWLPLHCYLIYTCASMLLSDELVGGIGQFVIWTFIAYIPLHYGLSLLQARDVRKEEGQAPVSLESGD
jgi:hypothetical protein